MQEIGYTHGTTAVTSCSQGLTAPEPVRVSKRDGLMAAAAQILDDA